MHIFYFILFFKYRKSIMTEMRKVNDDNLIKFFNGIKREILKEKSESIKFLILFKNQKFKTNCNSYENSDIYCFLKSKKDYNGFTSIIYRYCIKESSKNNISTESEKFLRFNYKHSMNIQLKILGKIFNALNYYFIDTEQDILRFIDQYKLDQKFECIKRNRQRIGLRI
ncbi:hypothetical protein EDEG_02198 [Edhazardia aedis USNM 41457]|uniref:Uncharacterized protein n=1 Tax=Edhazardia aedis (strain USNM 41457) TaxID=1003232 RepID=J8ZUS2_EDHAE|nr:hypothetical protein EDEG_02198 [Edhazardia aedis USNM 41457]|eukprot:EJW03433.1 hypothetical protein EDEG_02198 [Edhazardia aedis USNM 41457]